MRRNGDIFVIHAPEDYPRQEGLTCGETNLRGILAGFNISFKPPDSLRWRTKILGYSFIHDISELLEKHGLTAPVRHANRSPDHEKLAILKRHIDNEEPVLLAIGNGHLQRGVYNPIARYFIGHFITIYGYSEEKRVFYIYDSFLEGDYQEDIPVGNEVRTFNELLRDWNGPLYYKVVGLDHVYIPVGNKGD